MKNYITDLLKLFALISLLILALPGISEKASAGGDHTIGKHPVKGNFPELVDNIKSGLSGTQLLISLAEDLAKGLKNT